MMRQFHLVLPAVLLALCCVGAAADPDDEDVYTPMALGISLTPVPGYSGPLSEGAVLFASLTETAKGDDDDDKDKDDKFDGDYYAQWAITARDQGWRCNRAANAPSRACTIQLLNGTSCDNPGSPQWKDASEEENPWDELVITSPRGRGKADDTGLRWEHFFDRAVVFYDAAGQAALCGTKVGAFVAGTWQPFPGYSGSLRISGLVNVEYQPGATTATVVRGFGLRVVASNATVLRPAAAGPPLVDISWELNGTDPACTAGAAAGAPAGACGIHVHSWENGNIGGYLYNTTSSQANPWTNVSYVYKASGPSASVSMVPVRAGLTLNQLVQGAVVVKDATGTPFAFSSFYLPSV